MEVRLKQTDTYHFQPAPALIMFPSTLLLGSLLTSVGHAVAAPAEVAERDVACEKDDYGPFKLYAAPVDGSNWEQVKLIDLYTPRPTNDTIQVLSVYFSSLDQS
jgi:hypothetical protein